MKYRRPRHISEIINEMFGVRTYNDYLESDKWKQKRMRIMQKRGCSCEVCGCKQRLQVHHLTYERIGKELDSDLKILCFACHEREHGLRPKID